MRRQCCQFSQPGFGSPAGPIGDAVTARPGQSPRFRGSIASSFVAFSCDAAIVGDEFFRRHVDVHLPVSAIAKPESDRCMNVGQERQRCGSCLVDRLSGDAGRKHRPQAIIDVSEKMRAVFHAYVASRGCTRKDVHVQRSKSVRRQFHALEWRPGRPHCLLRALSAHSGRAAFAAMPHFTATMQRAHLPGGVS